jgi:signal transduction histidine kinase
VALTFRRRIFVWLVVIATVPAAIAVSVSVFTPDLVAPVGGLEAWERAGDSWRTALRQLDVRRLPPATRRAVERHSAEIATSLKRARQVQSFRYSIAGMLAGLAAALAVLVGGGAVQLAASLSRQLSRPIDELVAWTGLLAHGAPLPPATQTRGAPEFQILRDAFHRMAGELETARAREVEATQLRTFRDIARQVAHELKNPLTPLRFAVSRLHEDARPDQRELLEIMDSESRRIEQMAREFSTLGRLPEGPPAPVDLVELVEGLARASVPPEIGARITCEGAVPLVRGHYEPLRRAFQNLLLNAVDAVRTGGGQADDRTSGQSDNRTIGQSDGRTGGGQADDRTSGQSDNRTIGQSDERTGGGGGVPAHRRTGVPAAGATDTAAGTPPALITVTVAPATLEDRPAVRVAIADRGPGLAPDAVARAFEPYFTTKAHGTGLGLAIVRQTVLDHGGTITAANGTAGGAVFTVTLPTERA